MKEQLGKGYGVAYTSAERSSFILGLGKGYSIDLYKCCWKEQFYIRAR